MSAMNKIFIGGRVRVGQSEEQRQDSGTKRRDRECDRGRGLQVAIEIAGRTKRPVFRHGGSADGLQGEIRSV